MLWEYLGKPYYYGMYAPKVVYHLYNRSINFETVFRFDENYLYFLRKVRTLIVPYADILCYCLMPDHFHFMVVPKASGCAPSPSRKVWTGDVAEEQFQQMLSHQIKTLLSSYTKAFNRRYNRRGSLFQAKTKAKPGYEDFLPEDFELIDETPFTQFIPYLQNCFSYIHDNPVKAHYALTATDWEYSSAADYAGLREGTLCNYDLTKQLLGIERALH